MVLFLEFEGEIHVDVTFHKTGYYYPTISKIKTEIWMFMHSESKLMPYFICDKKTATSVWALMVDSLRDSGHRGQAGGRAPQ